MTANDAQTNVQTGAELVGMPTAPRALPLKAGFDLSQWYGKDAPFYLAAIHKDGGAPKRCDSLEQARKLNNDGFNVYLSANPIKGGFIGAKATEEDVTELRRVVLDVDPPARLTADQSREVFDRVIEMFRMGEDRNGLARPTMVFQSGRLGCLVFEFREPLPNTDGIRQRVKTLGRAMAVRYGADNTASVEHLFKAPLEGFTAWMKQSKIDAGWRDSELGLVNYSDGPTYSLEELEAAVGSLPEPTSNTAQEGWFTALGGEDQEAAAEDMLKTLNPDDGYDTWLRVGMGLEAANENLFEVWDQWSSLGATYTEGETAFKWASFKKCRVTIGTVIHLAKNAGWRKDAWAKTRVDHWKVRIGENPDDPELAENALRLINLLPDTFRRATLKNMQKLVREQNGSVTFNLSSASAVAKEDTIRAAEANGNDGEVGGLTHDDMALRYIEGRGEGNLAYDLGLLWQFNPQTTLWEPASDPALRELGQMFPGQALARRAGDFKAILERIQINLDSSEFFSGAVVGLATPTQFYRVEGDGVKCEPLTREHRARFKINVEPSKGEMPLLLATLKESIGENNHFEEQMTSLFQAIGLILVGEFHKLQKVLLIKGESNNFKSQLFLLISELFPAHARSAVRLTDFHIDTKVAKMVNSAINVAPEVTENQPINGDSFKAITGQDAVSANLKYKDTFFSTITAAQVTAGNHWPVSDEYSKAFFNRWLIYVWPNGKEDCQVDDTLTTRIREQELPQLVYWALEGARQYFMAGRKLVMAPVHYDGLEDWKGIRDSAQAFVQSDVFQPREPHDRDSSPVLLKLAWETYVHWCVEEGRKPLGKQQFNERVRRAKGVQIGNHSNREVILNLQFKLKEANQNTQ